MKRIITLCVLLAMFAIGAKAQMVGANEGQSAPTTNPSSLYKPIGHYLRLEAGFPTFFSIAYGYQFSHSFMVGAGAGFGEITYDVYSQPSYSYHYYGTALDFGIPFYAEIIYNTPKQNWSFFADVKIGVNVPIMNRGWYDYRQTGRCFYSALNIGVYHKNLGFYGGISTNSAYAVVSVGITYNIPLRIHK